MYVQVNRDYRGKCGQKADTTKPVWRPSNHPKFNYKSEMKNVSIGFNQQKVQQNAKVIV